MDLPTAALAKIRSDDLRHEAVAGTLQPHTVIVELDLPMPRLESTTRATSGLRGRPGFRFAAPEPAAMGVPSEASRIQASKEDIATITGSLPETYLSTAGSFVVKANGAQIGRIARMASVSAIWPNSRHGR